MNIRIKSEITTDVIASLDETGEIVESSRETFLAGEILDVDIFSDEELHSGLQFGDGSVTFLPNNTFEKLVD